MLKYIIPTFVVLMCATSIWVLFKICQPVMYGLFVAYPLSQLWGKIYNDMKK